MDELEKETRPVLGTVNLEHRCTLKGAILPELAQCWLSCQGKGPERPGEGPSKARGRARRGQRKGRWNRGDLLLVVVSIHSARPKHLLSQMALWRGCTYRRGWGILLQASHLGDQEKLWRRYRTTSLFLQASLDREQKHPGNHRAD